MNLTSGVQRFGSNPEQRVNCNEFKHCFHFERYLLQNISLATIEYCSSSLSVENNNRMISKSPNSFLDRDFLYNTIVLNIYLKAHIFLFLQYYRSLRYNAGRKIFSRVERKGRLINIFLNERVEEF